MKPGFQDLKNLDNHTFIHNLNLNLNTAGRSLNKMLLLQDVDGHQKVKCTNKKKTELNISK